MFLIIHLLYRRKNRYYKTKVWTKVCPPPPPNHIDGSRNWPVFFFSLCFVYRNENPQVADIFLKQGPYLKMYSTYIREFDRNVVLLDEQTKKNPAFGAVVREFEVMVLNLFCV